MLESRLMERISMLPITHNADSFGYQLDMFPRKLDSSKESYRWLLTKHWCGKVGLMIGVIGAIDAALAIQVAGITKFKDIGNLKKARIRVRNAALLKNM